MGRGAGRGRGGGRDRLGGREAAGRGAGLLRFTPIVGRELTAGAVVCVVGA